MIYLLTILILSTTPAWAHTAGLHHAVVITPFAPHPEAPPAHWAELLDRLVDLDASTEWQHVRTELGPDVPLGGDADRTALKAIADVVARLPTDRRVHLDVVIDGHGSPEGFAAEHHPGLRYESFAAELGRWLTVARTRGLGDRFTMRIFTNVCYSGGLLTALTKPEYSVADADHVTIVSATSDQTVASGATLYYSVIGTYRLIERTRRAGTSFASPGASAVVEFNEVFNTMSRHTWNFKAVMPFMSRTDRRDPDPPLALTLGRAFTDSPLAPPGFGDADTARFIEAFARTYLHHLQRGQSTVALEHFYETEESHDFRERFGMKIGTYAGPLLNAAAEHLYLQYSLINEPDEAWYARMRVLAANDHAFVRGAAINTVRIFSEMIPLDRIRDLLTLERSRPDPSPKVLRTLEELLTSYGVSATDCGLHLAPNPGPPDDEREPRL